MNVKNNTHNNKFSRIRPYKLYYLIVGHLKSTLCEQEFSRLFKMDLKNFMDNSLYFLNCVHKMSVKFSPKYITKL